LNHIQQWRKKAPDDSVPPTSMMERLATLLMGIGARIASLGAEARDLAAFIGLTLARSSSMYRRSHRLRLGAVLFQLQQIWLKALPLAALAPFLIALATTYVGAAQLGQLGAGNIAVQAIALAILWEIGVLLPAILVAGRSASAFAGEIGAMKAGEEIDSMFMIGLDPMVTLIIPRVVALLIALPLLGIVGQISGLVGCFLMASAHLGLSPSEYIERVESAAGINIFLVGLLKTPFFGLIIAFVGCFQGMKVSGAAIEVGERTTRAVVQALFLVILFDALYSVAFWMALQGP
jgi:phospholipid/cholesterol/gamma-HCH transport system permease protein